MGREYGLDCGRRATSTRAAPQIFWGASKISGSEMATLRCSPRFGQRAVPPRGKAVPRRKGARRPHRPHKYLPARFPWFCFISSLLLQRHRCVDRRRSEAADIKERGLLLAIGSEKRFPGKRSAPGWATFLRIGRARRRFRRSRARARSVDDDLCLTVRL